MIEERFVRFWWDGTMEQAKMTMWVAWKLLMSSANQSLSRSPTDIPSIATIGRLLKHFVAPPSFVLCCKHLFPLCWLTG